METTIEDLLADLDCPLCDEDRIKASKVINYFKQSYLGLEIVLADYKAAALWALYHHQGGSSEVGQPIRKLMGIGQHEHLTKSQIAIAKEFFDSHK